jgi:ferredoxin
MNQSSRRYIVALLAGAQLALGLVFEILFASTAQASHNLFKEWQIDSLKCCTCRRCVEVCPVKCLLMHNVYFPSVTERPAGLYLIIQPPKPPKTPLESPSGGPAAESGAKGG